jgi:hypothetical protein
MTTWRHPSLVGGAVLCLAAQAGAGECPPLDPADDGTGLAVPLVLSEIEPGTSIELFNATADDIDLDTVNFWLCSPFTYANLQVIGAGVTVPAGGYATVPFPSNFTDVDSGGEIILYKDISLPIDFANGSKMVDFLCWGVNPHFSRKALAESVGKWVGPCDGALTGGALHRMPATTGTGAASYDANDPPSPSNCVPAANPGDVNKDSLVNVSDLVAVVVAWGKCPPGACDADLDGDEMVGVTDLLMVMANWD